jgi:hypothetical protein
MMEILDNIGKEQTERTVRYDCTKYFKRFPSQVKSNQ